MKTDIIIYSKNRAAQLDLLLRSIKANFVNANNVFVLNDFDSDVHYKSYQKIWNKQYGMNVMFITQTKDTFYNVVINTLKEINTNYILPLCDDDVFIRKTDVSGILIDENTVGICLRRSKTLGISYHTGLPVKEPEFTKIENILKWRWRGEDPCRWGYPYQAGGMVYDKKFFEYMMNNIKFDLPNYLEYGMMSNKDKWGREHVLCFELSPIVNVSVNKVQNEVNNRGGRDVAYSPTDLTNMFLDGKIIDLNPLQDMINTCEFVELPFNFVEEK